MFEAPKKTSLRHLRAVKQLTTVALDMKRWTNRSNNASSLRVASLRGNQMLCEFHGGQETFSPVISATSCKLSQQQKFKKRSSFIWRERI